MPDYKVDQITAGANGMVYFFDTDSATPILIRAFGKVRNIRASEDRKYIVISDVPESEFRFDVWTIQSLGSTFYSLINPALPGAEELYRVRFNEIYLALSQRFFFGCCCDGGGDGSSTYSFVYEWNSGVAAGDFYMASGLLIMSQQSDLAQDLSGLLAEMGDGSLITFISQDDPSQFVIYELSNYSLLSGLVFYNANIVAGDSVGFADTTLFNTTFDKTGAGGGGVVWGDITGTIENQADLLAVVQNSEWTYLPVTGTNTLVGGVTPALTAYQEGQVFLMKPQNTNTGAVSLNIDSNGTNTLTYAGNALSAGVIKQNAWYFVARTATNFELVGEVILTQMSVTQDGLGIKLVNDEATPSPQYHYGADETAAVGWHQNFVTWDSVLANIYNPISSPNPSLTTGFQNTFYGIGIANPITSGQRNTAVGANLLALTTGASNTAVGYANLPNLTTNQFNTVIGTLNLYNNGYGNVIAGYGNMNDPSQAGTTGSYNVIMGDGCLLLCTGSENVAFGISVMVLATSANRNIAIGYQAGASITTGDTNIVIGDRANAAATANDQIVIGRQVVGTGTGLYIGYIQNASGPQALYYDPATNEITYNPSGGGGGGVASVNGFSVDNTDPTNPVVNAIPINGTDATQPLVGDIQIEDTNTIGEVNIYSNFNAGAIVMRISFADNGSVYISTTDTVTGDVQTVNVGTSGQVSVSSTDGATGEIGELLVSKTHARLAASEGATETHVEVYKNVLEIYTPAVNAGTALNGQVLTLIDETTGQAEWGNVPGVITWSRATSDRSLVVNEGVISDKTGSRLVLTLPTTASIGSVFEVVGINATGWRIAQNASQMIHFNSSTSTTGTGGYIQSTSTRDCVKVLCVVADLEFQVLTSSGGTITVN